MPVLKDETHSDPSSFRCRRGHLLRRRSRPALCCTHESDVDHDLTSRTRNPRLSQIGLTGQDRGIRASDMMIQSAACDVPAALDSIFVHRGVETRVGISTRALHPRRPDVVRGVNRAPCVPTRNTTTLNNIRNGSISQSNNTHRIACLLGL